MLLLPAKMPNGTFVEENQAYEIASGLPPYSEDAERALLGILLSFSEFVEAVIGQLRTLDFYLTTHQEVFRAILNLWLGQERINLITVANALKQNGKLEDAGGNYFLTGLKDEGVSAVNLDSYIRIILEKSRKRQRIALGQQLVKLSLNGTNEEQFSQILGALEETRHPFGVNSDRFVIHWAAEALQPLPPTEWLIKPVFARPSVSILYGSPGSKKTYVCLDAAVCVSLGKSWLEFETRQATVLIVDEESGYQRLRRRLAEVMHGHSVKKEIPIAFSSMAQFDFRKLPDVESLRGIIRKVDANFIIIDALADVMPGAEENSTKEVLPVLLNLRRLANEMQVAIVVLHHDNRGGGYRGSSSIKGAVDTMFKVQSENAATLITFTGEKLRDVEPFNFAATICFHADAVRLEKAEPVKAKERFSRPEEYVLRYLREKGASLLTDIVSQADICSETSARKAVYALVQKKKIRRQDGGASGTKAIYQLITAAVSDNPSG